VLSCVLLKVWGKGLVRVRVRTARVAPFLCISRCIGLSLSLSSSSSSLLFFRDQVWLRITFLFPQNNRALSLFLPPGGYCLAGSSAVTSCPAGAIDCCFDYTSLLCPHLFLMSCLVRPLTVCSRLLLSCGQLNAFVRIDVHILFIARICRDIFGRHGGHLLLDMLNCVSHEKPNQASHKEPD
jgi:hypothetical protein